MMSLSIAEGLLKQKVQRHNRCRGTTIKAKINSES